MSAVYVDFDISQSVLFYYSVAIEEKQTPIFEQQQITIDNCIFDLLKHSINLTYCKLSLFACLFIFNAEFVLIAAAVNYRFIFINKKINAVL